MVSIDVILKFLVVALADPEVLIAAVKPVGYDGTVIP